MTFTAVPWILENGARAYADYGMGRSLGTLGPRDLLADPDDPRDLFGMLDRRSASLKVA